MIGAPITSGLEPYGKLFCACDYQRENSPVAAKMLCSWNPKLQMMKNQADSNLCYLEDRLSKDLEQRMPTPSLSNLLGTYWVQGAMMGIRIQRKAGWTCSLRFLPWHACRQPRLPDRDGGQREAVAFYSICTCYVLQWYNQTLIQVLLCEDTATAVKVPNQSTWS